MSNPVLFASVRAFRLNALFDSILRAGGEPPVLSSAELLADGVTLRCVFDQALTAGDATGLTRSVGTITSASVVDGNLDIVVPKAYAGDDLGTLTYDGTGTLAGATGSVAAFGPVAITNNGPAWTPADLFAGGVTGFCLDGSPGASDFYEENTKVTLATSSGSDPVGAVTDVSGNANDALMSVSANRPTFYEDAGGIRAFKLGSYSSATRNLQPSTAVYATTACTVVAVLNRVSAKSNGDFVLSSTAGGAFIGTGYFIVGPVYASTSWFYAGALSGPELTASLEVGDAGIYIAERTGTGANESHQTTYQLDGTQIETVSGQTTGTPTGALSIGVSGFGDIGENIVAFHLYINKSLSAGEKTALLSYLSAKFGAWAP